VLTYAQPPPAAPAASLPPHLSWLRLYSGALDDDAQSSLEREAASMHADAVLAVDTSCDLVWVVTGGRGGRVWVWYRANLSYAAHVEPLRGAPYASIRELRFHPIDPSLLLVWVEDHDHTAQTNSSRLELRHVPSMARVAWTDYSNEHTYRAARPRWSVDGTLVLGSADLKLKLWDATSLLEVGQSPARPQCEWGMEAPIVAVASAPDGSIVTLESCKELLAPGVGPHLPDKLRLWQRTGSTLQLVATESIQRFHPGRPDNPVAYCHGNTGVGHASSFYSVDASHDGELLAVVDFSCDFHIYRKSPNGSSLVDLLYVRPDAYPLYIPGLGAHTDLSGSAYLNEIAFLNPTKIASGATRLMTVSEGGLKLWDLIQRVDSSSLSTAMPPLPSPASLPRMPAGQAPSRPPSNTTNGLQGTEQNLALPPSQDGMGTAGIICITIGATLGLGVFLVLGWWHRTRTPQCQTHEEDEDLPGHSNAPAAAAHTVIYHTTSAKEASATSSSTSSPGLEAPVHLDAVDVAVQTESG